MFNLTFSSYRSNDHQLASRYRQNESTVQMPEKTNRYPDFVRYIIQQFKSYCPMLGRFKIADILCRAGLHLSASTVKRIIDEPPFQTIELPSPEPIPNKPTVQAWYPNHVWSVDLTVVPTTTGLWTPWSPNVLTQVHPYLWHVMVVIDHYSRCVVGFDVFEQSSTASQVASTVKHICDYNNVKPKYLISDKWSCTRRILTPLSKDEMQDETELFFEWYNEHRPHMTLSGKTPNEIYYSRRAANSKPRIETRPPSKTSNTLCFAANVHCGKSGSFWKDDYTCPSFVSSIFNFYLIVKEQFTLPLRADFIKLHDFIVLDSLF